jgi:D-tyrosyl-tRNA(Tyr) deacylase
MRALLQRCSGARVLVGGEVVGKIAAGLVALVGTTHGDSEEQARFLARKTANLRIFPDGDVATGSSVLDIGGAVLVVSQFTLYADTRKGNRPSFKRSGPPDEARALIEVYRASLEELGVATSAGVFAANMQVELVNDGPFTVLLERDPSL